MHDPDARGLAAPSATQALRRALKFFTVLVAATAAARLAPRARPSGAEALAVGLVAAAAFAFVDIAAPAVQPRCAA